MRHLDLFSGIGGFALAARWVGWETVGFCEIDPYCQKVLKKHWPDVPIYEDVRELKGGQIGPVDVITGGFPCTDISVAGKQVGIEGENSGLWTELARIIGEIRPRYAVLENVSNLLSGDNGRWFSRVLGDLAEIGYDCEWHCIPASYVGAPHRRDRVWIVSYPHGNSEPVGAVNDETPKLQSIDSNCNGKRQLVNEERAFKSSESMETIVTNTWGEQVQGFVEKALQGQHSFSWCENFGGIEELQGQSDIPEPVIRRINDGVSFGMDQLKGLGNAVVPQIPEIIFRAINDRS